MGWNPYTDQKNRAYSGILTSLFPEQTKTLPRIILWSIVFLLDLILGIGGAAHFGLLEPSPHSKLISVLLIAAIIGIFWLQGAVWYGIVKLFHNRNRIEP